MGPERPEEGTRLDEAAVQRRVFVVRMAAWGTVLLLAVIAFNLRAGSSTGADQGANGPHLNGRTSEGEPIWAISEDDAVREIHMTWNFKCDNGGKLAPWGGTFRDSIHDFDRHGSAFRVEIDDDLPSRRGGWTAHLRAEIEGDTFGEGRAGGESSAVMWFTRGKERGATCRSERVGWSVP